MPIPIAGSGTITGISAGGLPDDSIIAADIASGAVTTAKVADANITAANLSGAQSGSAPIYGCRAWVNFNGSNGSIRTSGNVSSVTRNATGDYQANFTTAMPDTNYSALGTNSGSGTTGEFSAGIISMSTAAVRMIAFKSGVGTADPTYFCMSIFR